MHGLFPLRSELRLVCDRRVDGDAERALEIEFVNRRVALIQSAVPVVRQLRER